MAQFKPSPESLKNVDPAAGNLRYAKRAAEILEVYISSEGELPPWAEEKVREAAMALGMAVTHIRKHQRVKK